MEARQIEVLRRGWMRTSQEALSLGFIGEGKPILNYDGICLRRNYLHPVLSHVTTLNIMPKASSSLPALVSHSFCIDDPTKYQTSPLAYAGCRRTSLVNGKVPL